MDCDVERRKDRLESDFIFAILSHPGAELEPHEFMNSKKTHEVQSMSVVVACLAQRCGVKQVRAAFLRSIPVKPSHPHPV